MLHFGKKTPEREEWWAVSDMTGEVFGPFDPGTVWFETPLYMGAGDLLRLQRVADLILNEAHAGWERLQRALAFMQPNGSAVYRRFMDSGVLPRQTPALGLAGGLDVPGYLGDGAATGTAGLHTDDSKNGTSLSGFRGGSTASTIPDLSGGGPGGGHPGTLTNRNGGGGSYGARGSGSSSTHGSPGEIVGVGGVWEALRRNIFSRETIGFGSGGAGGTPHSGRGGNDGDGGSGGGAYIQIANGVLTTDSRNLNGFSGSDGTGGGDGGSGAGGLWLGIANRIVYASGTISTRGGTANYSGGDGRVIQIYFDSKATLAVTGAVEDQFRILRSVPIGQNTFL